MLVIFQRVVSQSLIEVQLVAQVGQHTVVRQRNNDVINDFQLGSSALSQRLGRGIVKQTVKKRTTFLLTLLWLLLSSISFCTLRWRVLALDGDFDLGIVVVAGRLLRLCRLLLARSLDLLNVIDQLRLLLELLLLKQLRIGLALGSEYMDCLHKLLLFETGL